MADRANMHTNGALDSSDNRAPLSSYLQYDAQEGARDGWTVFSFENDEAQPSHTPNLSVLKQIKNFLCNKSEETAPSFDSSDSAHRRLRVDYPYYDSEPRETWSPLLEESKKPVASELIKDFSGVSTSTSSPSQREDELSVVTKEVDDVAPDLSEEPEPIFEQEPVDAQIANDAPEEQLLTVELISNHPEEESEPTPEESVESATAASFNATCQESALRLKDSASATFTLDADELLGTTFQEVAPDEARGVVCEIIEAPCFTREEPCDVKGDAPESLVRRESQSENERFINADSHEERRIAETFGYRVSARRSFKSRLPIFQRFVDLVTSREATTEKRGATPNQLFSPTLTDNVGEETTGVVATPNVETVVIHCYPGANLSNPPLGSYVIGGGETSFFDPSSSFTDDAFASPQSL